MFDLFRSREKSVRYLLGTLLTLVAVSMVVTLIPGWGSGTGSSSDQIIAEVGKDVITMREVQLGLQDTLRAKNIPPELITIYVPQIVNQLVVDKALAYEANRLNLSANDEEVAQAIQQTIPQLYQDGKFVGKDMYAAFLAQQNLTIADFEKKMRERVYIRKIQNIVYEGMVVTPQEIEQEYRSRNEKVAVEYVALDPAQYTAEATVTPQEVQAAYNANKTQYRIVEKRTIDLIVVDEAKVAEQLQASDDELRRVYEANKDNFRIPERVRARHILLKTQGKTKEEEAKLKTKAEDLLKQLKGGADFTKLAKENSEDPGSKDKGGDLGLFGRGQMVKPFEDAAFSLKVNEISGVVKSDFGFHIIQTTEKEAARLKPFEEVKAEIAKERQKQMLYDKMQALADQSRAMLSKVPTEAAIIAQNLKINHYRQEKFGRGDAYPTIGLNVDLDDAIFEAKQGGVTNVVQVTGNKLVVAAVQEIFPSRQAELSEVEGQIKQSLASTKSQQILSAKTQEAMEKLKGFGGDMKKLAAAMKLTPKTTAEFGRDGAAEGIGSASYLEEAFRRDVGSVFGPVNVNGKNYICRVASKSAADMGKLADQRFDLLLKLKQRKAQERKDLFEDGLMQRLQDEGVVKMHKDTIKRVVDGYKTS